MPLLRRDHTASGGRPDQGGGILDDVRRAFFTPRWLGLHALLVVSVLVFARVGWWQWDKADGMGDWHNYGYGIQWWLFGVFAVFLWVKLVLDELDPSRVEKRTPKDEAPAEPLQPQAPPPSDEDDDELAAYNRHLAWLAQKSDR
jgi:DNA-binding transcriptional regulator of glucitol operon